MGRSRSIRSLDPALGGTFLARLDGQDGKSQGCMEVAFSLSHFYQLWASARWEFGRAALSSYFQLDEMMQKSWPSRNIIAQVDSFMLAQAALPCPQSKAQFS
jgi:hypothetical protein